MPAYTSLDKLLPSFDKLLCENLNISFCRYVLGVHKKSQLTAIRGELGRVPLGVDIVANILKYREYLENKNSGSILAEALYISKTIITTNTNRYWAPKCSQLQNLNKEICDKVNFSSRKSIKSSINYQYIKMWKEKIGMESKMRTYIKFKSEFILEDYMLLKMEQYRKSFTKFRISAHTLAVERGRYTRPKPTPLDQRTCPHCASNDVEDEFHFLMKCNMYNANRENLFKGISNICAQFSTLNEQN